MNDMNTSISARLRSYAGRENEKHTLTYWDKESPHCTRTLLRADSLRGSVMKKGRHFVDLLNSAVLSVFLYGVNELKTKTNEVIIKMSITVDLIPKIQQNN